MTSAVKIFTRHRAASALVPVASFRAVTLAFPLEPGVYLVVNGGSDIHTNAHLMTPDASIPRFRAWRGQSYGVDIVKLYAFGLRTCGVQVRAQRPGPAGAPLGSDPLPIPFRGRFPVRGDRIESP